MITKIKQAIVARLQPLSDRAKIVANDDLDETSGSNTQVQPDYQIRVGYAGGTYTAPDGASAPFQLGTRSFEISIQIRDFLSEDKAVALLEDIELLLLGYCPCVNGVAGDFYLQSDRFVQNRDGIYFYVITVTIPVHL